MTAPKVAVTKKMVDAGKVILDELTAADIDEHSDDELVANIFYAMWNAYWKEVDDVRTKKSPGSAIVASPRLILPKGMN